MNADDIALWSCGTWCYGDELNQMNHMSDDYQVVRLGTDQHAALTN